MGEVERGEKNKGGRREGGGAWEVREISSLLSHIKDWEQ